MATQFDVTFCDWYRSWLAREEPPIGAAGGGKVPDRAHAHSRLFCAGQATGMRRFVATHSG
jgi:hypothetical protein